MLGMVNAMSLYCCGWGELTGITRYEGDLNHFLTDLVNGGIIRLGGQRRGALLFTQAGSRTKYGKTLAKDLEAAGLGKVVQIHSFINPNTSKMITPFMWIPNREALQQYCIDKEIFPKPVVKK